MDKENNGSTKGGRSATFPLIVLTLAKLMMDINSRFLFPFLPVIARGLGVPLAGLQQLLGWQGGASLLGSLVVPLSERFGRRPFFLLSYSIFVVGMGLVFIFPSYWMFGTALIVSSFARMLFGASVHATIADVVPYATRGRSTAILELSWGLALLLGTPAAGWLIARFGWQSPYGMLAVLGLIGLILMWQYVPESHDGTNKSGAVRQPFWQTIRAHPSIIAAVVFIVLNRWGNQLLFISYANWMELEFGFTLGALGLSAVVIGLSELVGEGLVSGFSDRMNKKRFVMVTAGLSAVCYTLIPLISSSSNMALVALFVTFLTYEMSVVGAIPIFTELAPKARTIALAATGLATPLGHSIGAFTAPVISNMGGFQLVSSVATAVSLFSILILWLGVTETEEE